MGRLHRVTLVTKAVLPHEKDPTLLCPVDTVSLGHLAIRRIRPETGSNGNKRRGRSKAVTHHHDCLTHPVAPPAVSTAVGAQLAAGPAAAAGPCREIL